MPDKTIVEQLDDDSEKLAQELLSYNEILRGHSKPQKALGRPSRVLVRIRIPAKNPQLRYPPAAQASSSMPPANASKLAPADAAALSAQKIPSLRPTRKYFKGQVVKGLPETLGMPINYWWAVLFEENEKALPRFRKTDEELTAQMLRLFPGRGISALMHTVYRWRANYNRGMLPCQGNTLPSMPSLRYDRFHDGNLYVRGRKGRIVAKLLEDGSFEYYGPAKKRLHLQVRTRRAERKAAEKKAKLDERVFAATSKYL